MKLALNPVKGVIIERLNRFSVKIEVNNSVENVYLRNPGRLKELLVKGNEVLLDRIDTHRHRKTKYNLVAIKDGNIWVSVDSIVPNILFREEFKKIPYFQKAELIKSEYTLGNSRIDFYLRRNSRDIYVEVKSCTLKKEEWAMFPDAPTERGVRHLRELMDWSDRADVFIVFIAQREDVEKFRPNFETHPEFAETLCEASRRGVKVIAYKTKIRGIDIHLDREITSYPCNF